MRKRMNFIVIIIILFLISSCILILKDDKKEAKSTVPEDQWALNNNGQLIENKNGVIDVDLNGVEAWEITKGNFNEVIGVIDTGIEVSNPFLKSSIFTNEQEVPNNKLDDDNNGYIDDTNGWDFYNNDNTVYDNVLWDYHGTFIASLLIGKHSNENGVWGIAPGVKVLPMKFLQGSSGNIDDAIRAIDYAHSMGIKIINCSWDMFDFNESLYKKMKEYKDILFVTSGGKEDFNLKEDKIYPCSYDLENLVCVKAIDNKGDKYIYSGYGIDNIVAAPGVEILGMMPESETFSYSGTSFATAYVSGVAALVKSINKDLSSVEIADILISSTKGSDKGYVLDTVKALENASK